MQLNKKKQNRSRPETEQTAPEIWNESSVPIMVNEQVEDFLIKTRRLLLIGEIDEMAAAHICSYLQMFSLSKKPVYLYISSPGGCLASGYAIIDQMLACRCPVYTVIRGLAHSMGAIIAMFGQKGHRYSMPNSSLMLHSIVIHNPPDSIERHIKMVTHLKEDYNKKVSDMARRSKLSFKQLVDLMEETKWMTPKQAIGFGLIDGIWTPKMERAVSSTYARNKGK